MGVNESAKNVRMHAALNAAVADADTHRERLRDSERHAHVNTHSVTHSGNDWEDHFPVARAGNVHTHPHTHTHRQNDRENVVEKENTSAKGNKKRRDRDLASSTIPRAEAVLLTGHHQDAGRHRAQEHESSPTMQQPHNSLHRRASPLQQTHQHMPYDEGHQRAPLTCTPPPSQRRRDVEYERVEDVTRESLSFSNGCPTTASSGVAPVQYGRAVATLSLERESLGAPSVALGWS